MTSLNSFGNKKGKKVKRRVSPCASPYWKFTFSKYHVCPTRHPQSPTTPSPVACPMLTQFSWFGKWIGWFNTKVPNLWATLRIVSLRIAIQAFCPIDSTFQHATIEVWNISEFTRQLLPWFRMIYPHNKRLWVYHLDPDPISTVYPLYWDYSRFKSQLIIRRFPS